MMVQVIAFSHKLSEKTKAFLQAEYSEYRLFNVPFHIPKFYQTLEATEEAMSQLNVSGFDCGSHDPILVLLPGACVGAAAILAAFKGATGQLPLVLNVIRTDEGYVPCEELPVLDLASFSNRQRQRLRPQIVEVELIQ